MSSCFSFSYLSCLLVLSLFHFCLSNQNFNHALCIESERQALLRFKHGLIDETDRLASWGFEDRNCCIWAGIACDNSTGNVRQIHLPGLNGQCNFVDYITYKRDLKHRLKGDISTSLLDLKQLQHLDLSCNDFARIQVPEFIGSIRSLRYLNLSSSNFGGMVPPQLGNLSGLRVLCLSNRHSTMIDMRWLSSLCMLHHLDVSSVNLSNITNWLQVINTLPSLVQLHMSSCSLTSNIHPYIPSLNLTSLTLLDISFNLFDTLFPHWILSIHSLVSLNLGGCHFHGPIPNSIHSFRNLTSLKFLNLYGNYDFMKYSLVLEDVSNSKPVSLDISNCGVSSSLLDSLRNLTSLRTLRISSNQLTRRIPKSLGSLCNLREIDMSNNIFDNMTLTYLLEFFLECKSPALESLLIGKSGLSGHIPYSIGQLSSLKMLYISRNQLDGNLPVILGQLSKLTSLFFSYNSLTGVVTEAHFAKLVSLKRLYVRGNNLTLRVQVANWIPPFQLQRLYLNSWVLGPQFPLWLQSQKDLMYLDISNTSISTAMPESFVKSLPNLSYLNVSYNHIQGMLTLLGIPTTLEVVDLSSNDFCGSLHNFLCSNDHVTNINFLNLGSNHFSGSIPECWEKWSSLLVLILENNYLSGEIPKTLGFTPYLQKLSLRGNKISGRLPASLMNLANLEILQLGRNELVGSIPTWIGTKLTFLSILNLRFNKFGGSIPRELCYLVHTQILDLAHNNLSGNIPRCFNNFSVLSGTETNSKVQFSFYFGPELSIFGDSLVMKGREETYSTILRLVMLLDLSSNNLTGHIPSVLTSLVELKSLNLSRNQLSGRIPKNIGDMKKLESFDLSLNKLSGELPTSLSRLSFLSSFNVSYNTLIGRIPSSTQIQSFNESSFFGNKLCGAPLNDCAQIGVSDKMQDKEEDHGRRDWGLIISLVLGFVTGFWIIVASRTPILSLNN